MGGPPRVSFRVFAGFVIVSTEPNPAAPAFPCRAKKLRVTRMNNLLPVLLAVLAYVAGGATSRATEAAANSAPAAELTFKTRALEHLVAQVPGILKTFDAKTGRFGSGLFIVTDQNHLFPLAVAYATPAEKNRFHKDPKLLEVIMKGGDALIEVQDPQGRWRFDKKDGSYWGPIHMPWTYSRWIRAYALIKADMPAERRARWEAALRLGFSGISASALARVHNIPTHHAMALYLAGKALDRPDWQRQAADFMQQVVATQKEGGYWSENSGPVVLYDYVYVDALGVYYAASGDERVLPALRKAAEFHRHFIYPDGSDVETVDERNPYHGGVGEGSSNVGFTQTPEGRAYLAAQWQHTKGRFKSDAAASLVLYGREGPPAPPPAAGPYTLVEGGEPRALTLAQGPWFVVMSAYTAEPPDNRWIQDRQNLLSVWRKGPGLIAGGGNTKLQPAWSTFTIGDMGRLRHTAGEENPNFKPRPDFYHTPSSAVLTPGPEPKLTLRYGPTTATLQVRPVSNSELALDYAVTDTTSLPVFAHLTLLPKMGAAFETAGGIRAKLAAEPLVLDAKQLGGSVKFRGVDYRLPPGTTLHWPALPHNPYRKDGRAEPEEGRIELRIPLQPGGPKVTVSIAAEHE